MSSNERVQSASSSSHQLDVRAAPTLLTSTSRPPKRSAAAATAVRAPVRRREVGGDADRLLGAQVLELGRDGGGALGIAADDGDARAGARELLRGGQADARGSAGDQAATALESQLHRAIVAVSRRPGTRRLEFGRCPSSCSSATGRPRGTRNAAGKGITTPRSTTSGKAEAQAVAARVALDRPAALYSSDLPRARETAEEVAQRSGLEPVFDARWREVDVGEWLGLTPEEVQASDPEGYRRWLAGGTGWSQGESYAADGRARPRRRAARSSPATPAPRRRSCASRTEA